MATFEMPLEEMKRYRGITPVPADFDDFWKRALDELDGTDPDVEIKESSFKSSFADCHHLFFTGVRNARIHAP